MLRKDQLVSIVVPAYNEQGNVTVLFEKIREVMKGWMYEVIYIDDGSSDNTLKELRSLAAENRQVKYVSFSRNFGHQSALRCGLRYAKGEAVISMDADLQHPPKLIPELLKKWQDGYEIVYTIRRDTSDTSFGKRLTSSWFYRLNNFLSGLHIKEGAADFRLLDRKVVDVINGQLEPNLFLRGYIDWIGFKQYGMPYTPAKRFSGTSKYTLKKMLSLASTGVTQFSIKPLRLAFSLGIVAFLMTIIYAVYALYTSLSGHTVPGWLSIVVLIIFLQGIQFMLLGLLGEYLGRTFIQTKARPDYIVSEVDEQ